MHADALSAPVSEERTSWIDRMNGPDHHRWMRWYLVVVLAHWAEHLVQAFQIYALGWAVPDARGVLGHWFPWMVKSEALHYGYALVMLVGLWVLRHGFHGRARTWWMISFWIQFWHHIEHAVLQAQAILGTNLGDSPVPMSLIQFWVPRVELHLFYNTVVFLPMVVAMYHHMFPNQDDLACHRCSCAVEPKGRAS